MSDGRMMMITVVVVMTVMMVMKFITTAVLGSTVLMKMLILTITIMSTYKKTMTLSSLPPREPSGKRRPGERETRESTPALPGHVLPLQ